MTAALHPAAFAGYEVRLLPYAGSGRHSETTHAVYVRRRLAAGLLFLALCSVSVALVRTVLVDRGGVPASAPAIHPAQTASPTAALSSAPSVAASQSAASAATPVSTAAGSSDGVYVVRSGDTLWSIAQQFHGGDAVGDFVDRLVGANGGTSLQIGQALILP